MMRKRKFIDVDVAGVHDDAHLEDGKGTGLKRKVSSLFKKKPVR